MDLDQILKRVQWMDEERRKDKDIIAMLETRILSLEGSLTAANQQIKDLSTDLSRYSTLFARMDQYDSNLLQQRMETKRAIDELDKDIKKREEESVKVRRVELRALESQVYEISKGLEPLPKFEKGIQARIEEDTRLNRAIDELRSKIEAARRSEDEYTRTYRLLEEGRRQDNKRLTDLTGEVTTLRKRLDDQRGQFELVSNNLRKLETRLGELITVETERRDAQTAFVDKQNLIEVQREQIWKDWESRFQTVEKQATDVESQIQKLDVANRESKRVQVVLEDLNQKVERRITEITEVQRLSEERFRQEWVTFKADDQKRWTNYTLIQEESRNEGTRQLEKVFERITLLEDSLQEGVDLVEQINEQTEKRLQSLLTLAHDWVSTYERNLGRAQT